jgi:hypothetical protein
MKKNSAIKAYADYYIEREVIITGMLSVDPSFYKEAQSASFFSGLTDMASSYFKNHWDEDNKTASVLEMVAPAAIFGLLSALGLHKTGLLGGLLFSVFHIDLHGILQSIFDELAPYLKRGEKLTKDKVNNAVSNAVPAADQSKADTHDAFESQSFEKELRSIRKMKLCVAAKKPVTPAASRHWLIRLLGWLFTFILTAGGFMIAGDAIAALVGLPSGFTQNVAKHEDKPGSAAPVTRVTPTQTKFPVKKSYNINENRSDNWTVNASNTLEGISDMLVSFAKSVYDGLDNLDSVITSSPTFQIVRDHLFEYNHKSEGASFIFIPKGLASRKQIVDLFIDDVAERAK